MSTSVSAVYLHVVDAVVSKLRDEFINEGVDDSVLNELQGLWELKMMQCGVVQGPIERNSAPRGSGVPTPVHDLNVPYEGTEEYETPTAEMLFPPTPLQTPMQTPLPVEPGAYPYTPVGHSEYGTVPDTGAASADMKAGKPAPYMQPPSPWMNQRPLGVDVNVAYEEAREDEEGGGISQPQPPIKDFFMMTSGKRKREDYQPHILPNGYIPQQDGSGDSLDCSLQEKIQLCCLCLPWRKLNLMKNPIAQNSSNEAYAGTLHNRLKLQERKKADAAIASIIRMRRHSLTIPQCDGFDDVYDDGVRTEDYNTPSYYDPIPGNEVGTPKRTKAEASEDEEPPLNEDDDDEVDDLEQGDEEPNTNHLVLAQFEKVNRTKSKWKCTLKDGIMRLNNKDILFTKANGDFDF
ncbi:PREDICTED: transcription initiation factor IIA large subunit-like isoform X1 [Nelumbo nucifera]|uniref:Transcription initiation factor IIA large subunit-like isoform X1 n=1 Tax=Nelumbo nucifera TaxID=4432 RepID=A0A1U8AJ83_NELNU|nr:PREDICTED: transcription initiation factor IIA large subunit-like isoform X1 [Nelumbo nucifera]